MLRPEAQRALEMEGKQGSRMEAFNALVKAHGMANHCETGHPIGRYAVMQEDAGPADNGGPWWITGEDWRKLLKHEAVDDEDPTYWPPAWLFDLDTGAEYPLRMDYIASVDGPEPDDPEEE